MSSRTITSIRPGGSSAETAAVRWEPCRVFFGNTADDGMCGACGWPFDDHELIAAA